MPQNTREQLTVERFCIPVTLRCNLRCKLCAERAPYYEQPYHPVLSDLIAQVDRFFTIVDNVTMFDLTGGEPLLRRDLPQLIHYLQNQYGERIGQLRLTTNGTLVPSKELLDSLRSWEGRTYVIVDHYAVSQKVREAAEVLECAKISFEVRDYSENLHCNGWVDYGDFSKKHDTVGAKELFDACMVPRLGFFTCMVNGVLFPCARARLLHELGITSDGLDIVCPDQTREGHRKALQSFLNRTSLDSCAYCSGLCENSPRFVPAEQMDKPVSN